MDKTQNSKSEQELNRLDLEISNNKLIQDILLEERSPLTTVYEWTAMERTYEVKSRNWYVAIATIAMLFIVYSALTANLILIFLIISLILVVYSLYSIPPHKITHRITNKGLNSFNSLYLWRNFIYFWVTKRGKEYVINFEFKEKLTDLYYQRMIILSGDGDLVTIVGHLMRHIDYLSSNQSSGSIFSKFIEGEFIPLLKIVNLNDVVAAEEVKKDEKEDAKKAAVEKDSQKVAK